MNTPEDIQCLESMKMDHVASFGGHDRILSKPKSEQFTILDCRQAKSWAEVTELAATVIVSESSDTEGIGDKNETNGRNLNWDNTQEGHIDECVLRLRLSYHIMQSPKLVSLATRMKLRACCFHQNIHPGSWWWHFKCVHHMLWLIKADGE